MFRGVDLVAVSVAELEDLRVLDSEIFGKAGAGWSTRFGVTIVDRTITGRGRGWWVGLGDWRMPRRRHPVPLWLETSFEVCSENHPDPSGNAFFCRELSDEAVLIEAVRRLSSLEGRVFNGQGLKHELGKIFDVCDPDGEVP